MCAFANRAAKLPQMLVPCHDTKPSFMIFMRVLDLQELKNQVSQPFRPSHDAEMFEFHSHFLHVLVVQICIMHIQCIETQLMYKKAKRTRNNSKI